MVGCVRLPASEDLELGALHARVRPPLEVLCVKEIPNT